MPHTQLEQAADAALDATKDVTEDALEAPGELGEAVIPGKQSSAGLFPAAAEAAGDAAEEAQQAAQATVDELEVVLGLGVAALVLLEVM